VPVRCDEMIVDVVGDMTVRTRRFANAMRRDDYDGCGGI
jgi:hypothetical protein